MKKQITVSILLVLCVILVLGGVKFFQIRKAMSERFQPPPEAVTAALVTEAEWPRLLHAIGTLKSVQGADLRAEEAGRVSKINVESGAQVAAGTVLVELDTAVEEAELRGVEAHIDQTKRAYDRAASLREKNATSAANYEAAEWAYRDALASADMLRSKIARKKIISPFDGRAGVRAVNVGDYVAPGTLVIPVHALSTLYVDFTLPEQTAASLAPGYEVQVGVDAAPDMMWKGSVQAVDPVIDEATRTVRIRALVENSGEKLLPGMFADVELILPDKDHFPVVPASSVVYAPFGNSVYVIEADAAGNAQTVRQQIVKIGPRRGDLIAILGGIRVGDRIVTSGGFKLRPGVSVAINEALAPSQESNPHPQDS